MNPVLFPSHPIPAVSTVNRNRVTGVGNPNDSVVVYANTRPCCPMAVCEAGFEIGRTKADAAGNWSANVAYPNKSTISAFQFDSNPNQRPTLYSEFSNCYSCPGLVKMNFDSAICSGETVTFRGKIYSQANPYDSIVVKGDAVSICDSVIIVKIKVSPQYRNQQNILLCYQDTFRLGSLVIHKNHLIDSIVLMTAAGCDSVVTVIARAVGESTFIQTICDNASVTIGSTVFDKNNTSGIGRIPGAAEGGCDSVVFVTLTIKNFSESFYNKTLCPGQSVTVGPEVFDQSRTTGDVTLPMASSTGCDSLVHVSLLFPDNTGSFQQTLCRGDSVFIIDRYFSDRNTNAVITIANGSSFGCDTLITVSIILLPNAQGNYKNEICRDDTLNLNGELFFSGHQSGTILLTNLAANGCDSTVLVDITIIPDAIGDLDTSLCENQTLTLYNQIFSMAKPSGTIRIPDASSRMCDSFLNVRITFIPETFGNFNPTVCRNDTVTLGNQTFFSANPTGTVRLPGGSTAGCDSVITVALNFNPPIGLNFTANDLKCNQQNTGELLLNNLTGGSGNYLISVDMATPIIYTPGMLISNLSVGGHTIRVIDQLTCDTTFNFTINNSQVLTLKLPNDTTIKKGNLVNIVASVNFNFMNITWDPILYLSCIDCLNPTSTPEQTITYTLTVTDANGCSLSDQMTINVIIDQADIYIPNVFSPNGDNINDFFTPVFKFPDKTAITVFRIFDRWGNQLFERLNGAVGESISWDGSIDKEKVNPGVYVYAIQFVGEDNVAKWRSGDVTLMR
jgi:gliding motility-associated-like protein